jgi:hypothetical protein
MTAGKNYNIQTVSKQIATKSSHVVIGSSVAAGLTRYVTMVRVAQVTNGAAKGSRVVFCSAAASGTATNMTTASANGKLSIGIPSATAASAVARFRVPNKTIQMPGQPNTENPLFTVAASKWLTATLGSAAGTSATCVVFAQFYDQ